MSGQDKDEAAWRETDRRGVLAAREGHGAGFYRRVLECVEEGTITAVAVVRCFFNPTPSLMPGVAGQALTGPRRKVR